MAETAKHNMRIPDTRWDAASLKAARLRADGYDIDVTAVANRALQEFADESDVKTIERLDLKPRAEVSQ